MFLTYLMGAPTVSDTELANLGIHTLKKDEDGDRSLEIPDTSIEAYKALVRTHLAPNFWNEIIGKNEIFFLFHLKNGTWKELFLSPDTEQEIGALCSQLNNDAPEKTANVYRYLSNNRFYHDLMWAQYRKQIERG